jgi:hypothetical protein
MIAFVTSAICPPTSHRILLSNAFDPQDTHFV